MSLPPQLWFDAWIYDALMRRVLATTEDGKVVAGVAGYRGMFAREALTVVPAARPLVMIEHEGARRLAEVARIVAIDQIANPFGAPDVLHADGDFANSRPKNLAWGYLPETPLPRLAAPRPIINVGAFTAIRHSKESVEDLAFHHKLKESEVRRIRKTAFAGYLP